MGWSIEYRSHHIKGNTGQLEPVIAVCHVTGWRVVRPTIHSAKMAISKHIQAADAAKQIIQEKQNG